MDNYVPPFLENLKVFLRVTEEKLNFFSVHPLYIFFVKLKGEIKKLCNNYIMTAKNHFLEQNYLKNSHNNDGDY